MRCQSQSGSSNIYEETDEGHAMIFHRETKHAIPILCGTITPLHMIDHSGEGRWPQRQELPAMDSHRLRGDSNHDQEDRITTSIQ